MDPAWFRWLVLAVQRVPHVRCGPHDARLSTRPFHFIPSNHGHVTAVVPRYGTGPTITCLGDPSRATQWRSKAGSHNGDPSRFTQWRSRRVHTMEIQSRFTQWRSKAGSHNGDPKPVHTMEIQAGSHNGDPNWLTTLQWESLPNYMRGLCLLSSFMFNGRLTFSRVGLLCGALFL